MAVTVAPGYTDKCIFDVFGPMKMEFVPLSVIGAADTYESNLANPQYAIPFLTAASGNPKPYCTVSIGTVTITNGETAGQGFILVFGF